MPSSANPADLILKNGVIWRGKGTGTAQALAAANGRIFAVGTDADVTGLIGPDTQVIDLGGRFATPGLNEDHLHLIATGLALDMVDASVEAAPTLQALMDALRARAAETPKGEWVIARGYDQAKLDVARHPHLSELDAAVPDHPVLLRRACGHVSIVNSRAMKLAGITADTPAPDGGVIEVANGRLTGFLAENAQELVDSQIPEPSVDQITTAIERAGAQLLSQGITSCMDAAVGMVAGVDEIRAYHLARRDGSLPVRVSLTLLGDPSRSIVEDCHRLGLVTGVGDDMLRVGAVKVFLDGSVGGRTAWMRHHYLDQPKNFGVQMLPTQQVEGLIAQYHDMGYQMACHAIGDGAINQLVTAYEKALEASPDADRRHRVEHCGYPDEALNQRMKAAGIEPSPQQVFLYDFGDSYISVMGKPATESAYPLKTWLDMGFHPGTGSDSPVCRTDPFPNLYSMVTRKTWKGTVMDEREAVDIETALQVYTENGAYLTHDEGRKGRLEVGMLADIAVFSRNLLDAAPEDILNDTECDLTIIDGRIGYDRHGLGQGTGA
ncbi:MAG: amidohydrolase [Paracoccus denitrificans]|nr:MAG: amidohydrolase [Paracoccus denitrificans]PZO86312.1 MAG: amidohydrolase [Paracoccus denitrificans]